MTRNLRRIFYAIYRGEVRAFHTSAERDAFIAECTGTNALARPVTYREIKKILPATLPGGRRRFMLPDGTWIGR